MHCYSVAYHFAAAAVRRVGPVLRSVFITALDLAHVHAARAPGLARSKNERDSVHCYSVAHHLVAPRKALCTESLICAANSIWGGLGALAPRLRENPQQNRETQCTELYAAL